MALGDNYIDAATFKAHAQIGDTDNDTEIAAVLTAVSRQVERYCGRQFNKSGSGGASGSAREFFPSRCGTYVLVDDMTGDGSITVEHDTTLDGSYATTIASTKYTFWPQNQVVDGISGWPYTRINLHNGQRFTVDPEGRPTVRVTAHWGWAAVPTDVTQAVLIQATRIFRRKYSAEGLSVGAGEFVFRTPAKLDGDVEALLLPYRRQVMVA